MGTFVVGVFKRPLCFCCHVCQWILGPALALLLFFVPATSPAQMDSDFSGGGAIRIGDSTTDCDINATGAVRYHYAGADTLDYCNGSASVSLLTNSIGDAIVNGGTELLRVDSSGNVGIGVTSPAYDLHVANDQMYVQATGAGAPILGNNNTATDAERPVIRLSRMKAIRLTIRQIEIPIWHLDPC